MGILRIIAASTLSAVVLVGLTPMGSVAKEPAPKSSRPVRRELVQLMLRSNVHVQGRVVRLGDIATISGGELQLREHLKRLDLEDTLLEGESVTITPSQIEFRLRVAGVALDNVSIRGSAVRVTSNGFAATNEVHVVSDTSSEPGVVKPESFEAEKSSTTEEGPLEHALLEAAKRCILRKLPWSAEDVEIRLSQPLPPEIRQVRSALGYECQAELRNPGAAIGRVHLRLVAQGVEKQTIDVVTIFDVRHYDTVVLTTRPLERGHKLTVADLYTDRQDVTDLTDYSSRTAELVGMTTKRAMRPLTPLRQIDIESTVQANGAILVKRRDSVRIVGRLGAVSVIATGEALQEGRLGELIRLRNTDSNTNVQGRVTGPGEVEILF
ncbi:flagellar basal body P-ring formation chaperone FlgA [Schlesneria paludicola]|uniref:flagellar basal body P-ring formation chaperone FlgA n=1 Tax=Schlesneria paludicola TaxID=360056 RepID=UPI00029A51D4|nr:flagellar basal body P-ring formation chaperone FlgA [Schlesneria paludicola]